MCYVSFSQASPEALDVHVLVVEVHVLCILLAGLTVCILCIHRMYPMYPPYVSFSQASPEALDLLMKLLVYDPSQRINTEDGLEHE